MPTVALDSSLDSSLTGSSDVEKCQRILKAVEETKGSVQGERPCQWRKLQAIASLKIGLLTLAVLFNYRYNPAHWKVEELIAAGKIGNVKSVHFEWLLVSYESNARSCL